MRKGVKLYPLKVVILKCRDKDVIYRINCREDETEDSVVLGNGSLNVLQ
jgi:hypothetical protein